MKFFSNSRGSTSSSSSAGTSSNRNGPGSSSSTSTALALPTCVTEEQAMEGKRQVVRKLFELAVVDYVLYIAEKDVFESVQPGNARFGPLGSSLITDTYFFLVRESVSFTLFLWSTMASSKLTVHALRHMNGTGGSAVMMTGAQAVSICAAPILASGATACLEKMGKLLPKCVADSYPSQGLAFLRDLAFFSTLAFYGYSFSDAMNGSAGLGLSLSTAGYALRTLPRALRLARSVLAPRCARLHCLQQWRNYVRKGQNMNRLAGTSSSSSGAESSSSSSPRSRRASDVEEELLVSAEGPVNDLACRIANGETNETAGLRKLVSEKFVDACKQCAIPYADVLERDLNLHGHGGSVSSAASSSSTPPTSTGAYKNPGGRTSRTSRQRVAPYPNQKVLSIDEIVGAGGRFSNLAMSAASYADVFLSGRGLLWADNICKWAIIFAPVLRIAHEKFGLAGFWELAGTGLVSFQSWADWAQNMKDADADTIAGELRRIRDQVLSESSTLFKSAGSTGIGAGIPCTFSPDINIPSLGSVRPRLQELAETEHGQAALYVVAQLLLPLLHGKAANVAGGALGSLNGSQPVAAFALVIAVWQISEFLAADLLDGPNAQANAGPNAWDAGGLGVDRAACELTGDFLSQFQHKGEEPKCTIDAFAHAGVCKATASMRFDIFGTTGQASDGCQQPSQEDSFFVDTQDVNATRAADLWCTAEREVVDKTFDKIFNECVLPQHEEGGKAGNDPAQGSGVAAAFRGGSGEIATRNNEASSSSSNVPAPVALQRLASSLTGIPREKQMEMRTCMERILVGDTAKESEQATKFHQAMKTEAAARAQMLRTAGCDPTMQDSAAFKKIKLGTTLTSGAEAATASVVPTVASRKVEKLQREAQIKQVGGRSEHSEKLLAQSSASSRDQQRQLAQERIANKGKETQTETGNEVIMARGEKRGRAAEGKVLVRTSPEFAFANTKYVGAEKNARRAFLPPKASPIDAGWEQASPIHCREEVVTGADGLQDVALVDCDADKIPEKVLADENMGVVQHMFTYQDQRERQRDFIKRQVERNERADCKAAAVQNDVLNYDRGVTRAGAKWLRSKAAAKLEPVVTQLEESTGVPIRDTLSKDILDESSRQKLKRGAAVMLNGLGRFGAATKRVANGASSRLSEAASSVLDHGKMDK